jgi:hypothetical protein
MPAEAGNILGKIEGMGMTPILSLWLPIVLAAVFVFIVSSIVHMATPFHRRDLNPLPQEDAVMEALRRFDLPPGDYGMPHGGSMAAMKDPGFLAKMKAGPVAFMTVIPSGLPDMGPRLMSWLVYLFVVSGFTAYVTAHAMPVGAPFRGVFRIAGCTAFAAYALALPQFSIWYRRNWGTTLRGLIDGVLNGAVTAATFAWLWPH